MWRKWRLEIQEALSEDSGYRQPVKKFTPKYPGIPILDDYRVAAPEAYWRLFPHNKKCPAESSVKHEKLKQLIDTLGVTEPDRADRVLERMRNGANIGCEGRYREPSRSKNSPDSYNHGPQISDAVAAWIDKGFAYGPVDGKEVPATAKISGIMTRVKPDSSVRIILNLSAPKGRSVNDGINAKKFPAVMSSTLAWLTVMNLAGRGCWLTKTDFADAYKHVVVRAADTDLQWFQWAGKYFKELCLIFGSASSAGIFDDLAKVILDLVCRGANFPAHMVCQHLDDICAADNNLARISKFDNTFKEFANFTGIKLAPRENPDKSFAPSKSGTVFGINYDTETWTWSIPQTGWQSSPPA